MIKIALVLLAFSACTTATLRLKMPMGPNSKNNHNCVSSAITKVYGNKVDCNGKGNDFCLHLLEDYVRSITRPICPVPECPAPKCPATECQQPICHATECQKPVCLAAECPKPICPTPECPRPACPTPECPTCPPQTVCPTCPTCPTCPPPTVCPICQDKLTIFKPTRLTRLILVPSDVGGIIQQSNNIMPDKDNLKAYYVGGFNTPKIPIGITVLVFACELSPRGERHTAETCATQQVSTLLSNGVSIIMDTTDHQLSDLATNIINKFPPTWTKAYGTTHSDIVEILQKVFGGAFHGI